jgi:hypothetical protein
LIAIYALGCFPKEATPLIRPFFSFQKGWLYKRDTTAVTEIGWPEKKIWGQ